MTTLQFSTTPSVRHRVTVVDGAVRVDDAMVPVRPTGRGCFVTVIDGRSERLYAVAHGDAVYVQLKGRAWRIIQVDPTRAAASASAGSAGASLAPMPGVVVSVHAAVEQTVRQGDALLVIESMKLQMTIAADAAGVVTELPFAVGQTFQRGAVLVRLRGEGMAQ